MLSLVVFLFAHFSYNFLSHVIISYFSERLFRIGPTIVSQSRLLSHSVMDAGGHGPVTRGTKRYYHVQARYPGIFSVFDIYARYRANVKRMSRIHVTYIGDHVEEFLEEQVLFI